MAHDVKVFSNGSDARLNVTVMRVAVIVSVVDCELEQLPA
jgi:hypothetical protein